MELAEKYYGRYYTFKQMEGEVLGFLRAATQKPWVPNEVWTRDQATVHYVKTIYSGLSKLSILKVHQDDSSTE